MTKLLFTLAIVFCLLPTAGAAAVFTVTKETDDDGPCDPDDCALREAVLAANAAPGPDVILFCPAEPTSSPSAASRGKMPRSPGTSTCWMTSRYGGTRSSR